MRRYARFITFIALTVAALVPARVFATWLEGQRPVFTGKIAAVFDTPGTYTWTVPDGVWRIMVELWGGGARGNYSDGWWGSSIEIGAGGGYGFAYIDVVPGMTCHITVGAGGSSDYDPGDTSSITCGTTTYYAAGGYYTYDFGRVCHGGVSNAPLHIQGQGCGGYSPSDDYEKDGGGAGRGGFGTKEVGIWPGGGGGTGSGAPGGVVIYY